jgi:hypothetical protein
MAQKIVVQDGNVLYATSDPTQSINFGINGYLTVTEELTVGTDVLSPGLITSQPGQNLTVQAGAGGNLILGPTSSIVLNNVSWPTGSLNVTPGQFLGASSLNTLQFYPFVIAFNASDNLTVTELNSLYPTAQPGQSVVGPTVIYECVSSGNWRFLGDGNLTNGLTFNALGTGSPPGTTFDGSSAITVSYNTVGAPSTTGANASGTWGINITGSASSASNLSGGSPNQIPYQVLTGSTSYITAPSSPSTFLQWNGSTFVWVASSTTLTNSLTFNNSGSGAVSGTAFDGTAPVTVSYNTIGATVTTGTNASGTWPISITGNAATATLSTTATNINNGLTDQIPYQTAPGLTGFITAPSVAETFLQWDGTNFSWGTPTGVVTTVMGSGAGISVSPTTGNVVVMNTGVTSIVAGTNISISGATGAVTINVNGTVSSATTATTATNIASGLANQILYQTAPGLTGFITAPSVASTFLEWNGTAFVWAATGGGGGSQPNTQIVYGTGAGESSSPNFTYDATTNIGQFFVNTTDGVTKQSVATTPPASTVIFGMSSTASTSVGGFVNIAAGDGGSSGNTGKGGSVQINAGNSLATVAVGPFHGDGGSVSLIGGNASTSAINGAGGEVLLTGGTGGFGTGAGGDVTATAGDGVGASGGAGGNINLNAGNYTGSGSAAGGNISLTSGTSTNGAGGNISVIANNAATAGGGGAVTVTAGNSAGGGDSSDGGSITATAGNATGSSAGNGGSVLINGGTGPSNGGAITITGGQGTIAGSTGGVVTVQAGAGPAGAAGAAGDLHLYAGNADSTSGTFGGNVQINAGVSGPGSVPGNVALLGGSSPGSGNTPGGNVTVTAGVADGTGIPGIFAVYTGDTSVERLRVDDDIHLHQTSPLSTSATNGFVYIPVVTASSPPTGTPAGLSETGGAPMMITDVAGTVKLWVWRRTGPPGWVSVTLI